MASIALWEEQYWPGWSERILPSGSAQAGTCRGSPEAVMIWPWLVEPLPFPAESLGPIPCAE